MSKKLIVALLLIALTAVVLIMNARGYLDIRILPNIAYTLNKSIALLISVSLGVIIGLLLK
jgi:hypothetical protein